jgi:hypothetical protein
LQPPRHTDRHAAETIAENALKGKQGEALTHAKLGGNVAGEQVSFRTSDGSLARRDFLTKGRWNR